MCELGRRISKNICASAGWPIVRVRVVAIVVVIEVEVESAALENVLSVAEYPCHHKRN
jgi:hypothetical protein